MSYDYDYGYENEDEHSLNDQISVSIPDFDDATTAYSISSNAKRQIKMMEELKKMDKGYNKTYRYNGKKRIAVEFYTTNITPGHIIRNAITGVHQSKFLVGSRCEDLFYKVANSCDVCSNDQHIMFFDSPEQYERHFHTTVSQVSKEEWLNKFNKEQIRRS
jgi:hypothetical protein